MVLIERNSVSSGQYGYPFFIPHDEFRSTAAGGGKAPRTSPCGIGSTADIALSHEIHSSAWDDDRQKMIAMPPEVAKHSFSCVVAGVDQGEPPVLSSQKWRPRRGQGTQDEYASVASLYTCIGCLSCVLCPLRGRAIITPDFGWACSFAWCC